MTAIHYIGRDRNSQVVSGKELVEDVAAFVSARYRARWQSLTVWALCGLGAPDELGAISVDDDGKRSWWGQRPAAAVEDDD